MEADALNKIAVIVAHYAPEGDEDRSHRALERTLGSLVDAESPGLATVLVCDDGSPGHAALVSGAERREDAGGREVFVRRLDDPMIAELGVAIPRGVEGLWLYLPKVRLAMCKARLWNLAARLTAHDRLVFLDDDHELAPGGGLKRFAELLERFPIVFGQVVGRSGRPRPFTSRRVQGTTFALRASVLRACGGFGEWTEAVSCGIDSDLWWKLYRYAIELGGDQACYTSSIRTVDSINKRWKKFSGRWNRRVSLRRAFEKEHGCADYRDPQRNPSRCKERWMVDLT
ncbi:MAG: hypothetical protein CME06_17530 [Gemmatimonadetes bacterium]|nr:hypothetical protein [Gemmatimonadota bacterium]